MDLVELLNGLTCGDDSRAEAAVQCLVLLPEEAQLSAISALRQLLASPEVDRRWWAARALAELPVAQTHGLLAQALKDPDPSVRQCAALGLRLQIKHAQIMRPPGWCPAPEILDALLGGLEDPDPLAARLAADALAAIGEPVVPQLLELLEASSHTVRLQIVRSLAAIGDQRAIPALFAALDDDSFIMEYWANEGLEKMGVGMTYFFP